MDLRFKDAPRDLMKKFVDTLIRLPNLRTLDLLSVSHRSPVTVALKRKCAKFPNIRELTVSRKYPDFVKSCPNLESLTFRYGLGPRSRMAIDLCGAGLKRFVGLDFFRNYGVQGEFVKTSPNLERLLNRIVSQTWYNTSKNSRK